MKCLNNSNCNGCIYISHYKRKKMHWLNYSCVDCEGMSKKGGVVDRLIYVSLINE
jgi:PHP family Zn ribbon phosphoesterase